MGMTGFNLARRRAEAAQAASVSLPASTVEEAASPVAMVKQTEESAPEQIKPPRRRRRKPVAEADGG
jgi:hypothetical protein